MNIIEVIKAKTDGMPDEVVITITAGQAKELLFAFAAPQKPIVLPELIPKALYQVLFDECGGFVECEIDTGKVWKAFKAAIEADGDTVKS